ncbi:MAG: phospholipase D-like domain-containing protein [Bacteriovorax sp.]|jgi:phosphatidylserine/phosphatidylglycerophosphate/cardiolipin synthase-like enzyme
MKTGSDKYSRALFKILVLLALFSSCSSSKLGSYSTPIRQVASTESSSSPGPKEFPLLTTDKGELNLALKTALKKSAKGMPEAEFNAAVERLRRYLMFLGLTAKDFKKAEKAIATVTPEGKVQISTPARKSAPVEAEESGADDEDADTPSNLKAIQRLFIASTQFLECQNLTDWTCLEKTPKFKPRADFRLESKPGLGDPVPAGESLDMEVFFTEGWDGSPRSGLSDRFAEKLEQDVGKSLSLAMYGIDDINGSMNRVYNAVAKHARTSFVDVRAVIDVSGFEKGKSPWVFDYVRPEITNPNYSSWLFGESITNPGGMHATFQYDGTPRFINEMNNGIKSQLDSRVRIEWSTSHIMHNKFAVLEDNDGIKSVWTGTANISKNCMGLEANSNMSVYIKNDFIANAFLDQFNLMFNFDPTLPVKSKLVRNSDDKNPVQAGRFHRNKYPATNRFFTFDDGTNLRVHFAPTDDAEHRVILPMLLSAKEGDEIRIAMFGGTGYEIVRAMQYAAAKGANVRIAYDSKLGHGLTSWTRDRVLNVFMNNPYIGKISSPPVKPGNISVRISTWKGKNHYKAGTLTRRLPDGEMHAEQIIVGSQNWSGGGNDANDENLISIQNLASDVPAAKMFNQEFDTRLWAKSREERAKPVYRIIKPMNL